MAFRNNNFYSNISNISNSKTLVATYEYYNEADNDVTVAGYFPTNIGLKANDRIFVYDSTKEEKEEYIVVIEDGVITVEPTGITTIKSDLDDLGDQVQTIQGKVNTLEGKVNSLEAKHPTLDTTTAGDFVIVATVDAEGAVTYSYKPYVAE